MRYSDVNFRALERKVASGAEHGNILRDAQARMGLLDLYQEPLCVERRWVIENVAFVQIYVEIGSVIATIGQDSVCIHEGDYWSTRGAWREPDVLTIQAIDLATRVELTSLVLWHQDGRLDMAVHAESYLHPPD